LPGRRRHRLKKLLSAFRLTACFVELHDAASTVSTALGGEEFRFFRESQNARSLEEACLSKSGKGRSGGNWSTNPMRQMREHTPIPLARRTSSGARDQCALRSGQQEPFARDHGFPLVQIFPNTSKTIVD
jgi:hypothetical protein